MLRETHKCKLAVFVFYLSLQVEWLWETHKCKLAVFVFYLSLQVEWLWETQKASGQWRQLGNVTTGERANDDNACFLRFSVLTVASDDDKIHRVVRCYVIARNHSYVDLAGYLNVPFGVEPDGEGETRNG